MAPSNTKKKVKIAFEAVIESLDNSIKFGSGSFLDK